MEIPGDSESPCLDKFQREAFLCLNTFPEKVTELNNLIDEYTPDEIKKTRGNVIRQTAPSCLSINSTTSDYYFHDYVGSCYSATTYRDRCKSRNRICKKKYQPHFRRRSRPLAHILAILVNRLAVCTQAVFIKPSKFIIDSVAAMFPHREQLRHVQCGTSPVWNALNSEDHCGVVNSLISIVRPAAVRLIADTTILKRWLQALALASVAPSQSLSQAIRTTETIDGWAYELFFHLKYLQVVNFPREAVQDIRQKSGDQELTTERAERPGNLTIFSESDVNVTDEVLHTNLWHRIVQLRDHYVILFETLRSNGQFLEPEEAKNVCPVPD